MERQLAFLEEEKHQVSNEIEQLQQELSLTKNVSVLILIELFEHGSEAQAISAIIGVS
jgi:hypothetical protein